MTRRLRNVEEQQVLAFMGNPKAMQSALRQRGSTQIAALKNTNKTLRQEADKWRNKAMTLVPSTVKAKVAEALHEQSTNAEIRLGALQAWNGLGLNNIGR